MWTGAERFPAGLALPFDSCVTWSEWPLLSLCLGFRPALGGAARCGDQTDGVCKAGVFLGVSKLPLAAKGTISDKTRKTSFSEKINFYKLCAHRGRLTSALVSKILAKDRCAPNQQGSLAAGGQPPYSQGWRQAGATSAQLGNGSGRSLEGRPSTRRL